MSRNEDKFEFDGFESIGVVSSVDTAFANVAVEKAAALSRVQVNRLVAILGSNVGETFIGLVAKIVRKPSAADGEAAFLEQYESDSIRVVLVGTFHARLGMRENVFSRSLASVPTVNAEAYLVEGDRLSLLMRSIASGGEGGSLVALGHYAVDGDSTAYIDGNRLFQRHAAVVGSTGSGKSWLVAGLVEKIAALQAGDAVLFDLHGEYAPLGGENIACMRIAGPSDSAGRDTLFLPYWLLTYDEMLALLLDRSDSNAPNQASVFSGLVLDGKRNYLKNLGKDDEADAITIDSPVPYSMPKLLKALKEKDEEMVQGSGTREKQGPFHGKLTRFIQRLEGKVNDRRLRFMFADDASLMEYDYAKGLAERLMSSTGQGVKIIDFSEVPSDVLPLVAALVARFLFTVQQWTDADARHPIALLCDEAHLYMSTDTSEDIGQSSDMTFRRIAKEGRKYGVGLVVITQRPSEADRTVLSQCNNFIAMRLTNVDDQNTVKRLLPDNLGNLADTLPLLDTGEAIVVGDACLLPSKIVVDPPSVRPRSATMDFYSIWASESKGQDFAKAITNMRLQHRA